MAYKIVKQARAWWPVIWTGVTEDGDLVENMIELRFNMLKVDAAAAFIRDCVEAQAREGHADTDLPATYADLVSRIAGDWRHVQAENGDALPWSPDNLRSLMNEGGLFGHIFTAFRACLAGQKETRAGN